MPSEVLVHIVDDDEAVRESLAFLLDSAGVPSRTYASAELFLAALPVGSGCVVTDLRMPGMSGLDLLGHLGEEKRKLPVIVVTGHGDVPLAVEAMKLGAIDFIEKPFDDEVMLASIRAVLARGQDADARDRDRVDAVERIARLSGREKDVLEGLVAGKPNKVIAYDLGISPRTVEFYRANVMTKTQASSLSELVRLTLLASGFTR
jgi:two-component system, LuxR family, response regulator FixJ